MGLTTPFIFGNICGNKNIPQRTYRQSSTRMRRDDNATASFKITPFPMTAFLANVEKAVSRKQSF